MTAAPLLKVERLHKSYETREGVFHAVRGVSFEVPAGRFFTLLGPSGCGKTTTLRCLAGLEEPDAGRIEIDGRVVADPAAGVHVPAYERDIGMVFQSYAIWPHMDVFSNVAYPLRVRKPRPPKEDIRAQVMEALRLVGMEAMAERPATRLSGGQQQRVAFARALVRRPKLLLLDEPLSNLDAKLREQMRFDLQELVERVAITTIYVTHDQSEALAMSDTVAVMSEGLVAQSGAPRTVYHAPSSEFVASFLGAATVLAGRVEERLADGSAIVASDGGRLRVPVANGAAAGDRVSVVFRPEDTEVALEAAGDINVLAGAIDRTSFQGGTLECHLRVGDSVVRSLVRSSRELERGAPAWLRVDAARCLVFPAREPAPADRTAAGARPPSS
jgi:iron(III) transport system ATP-binding protein